MESLQQQIIETWNIHNRSMLLFIENMPDDAFSATLSKRGGRDIGRQLSHVLAVRLFRLESWMKKCGKPMVAFATDYSPGKEELLTAFQQSGELMESYIAFCTENDGAVSNFKRGVVAMLGYYITHEAHHKGHALLTMKECGIKTPDALKWGIWEWNKI